MKGIGHSKEERWDSEYKDKYPSQQIKAGRLGGCAVGALVHFGRRGMTMWEPLWQLHLPPPFYFWMEEYLERVIIGGAGLQVWFVYYVFVVNRTGSISQLITILHSCGQEIPRAVLFHVFRFFLTWPVIQIGAGGSVERKKGRQRGIEGVASVVNEKITGSLPSGSCTKAVMT